MNELIRTEDGNYLIVKDVVDTIVTIEKEMKKMKEIQDNYKEKILQEMERLDVLKIDIPELTITRKTATTRETLDSKALRIDMPEIYDDYVKITDVKGSVTIKIK